MTLQIDSSSDYIIIKITGDFDASAVSEARPKLDEILNDPSCKLVFNLEALKFIDSTGIGFIVYVYKRLKASGGSLSIACVKGQPAELISVLKVDQVISMYDDVSSACSV